MIQQNGYNFHAHSTKKGIATHTRAANWTVKISNDKNAAKLAGVQVSGEKRLYFPSHAKTRGWKIDSKQ